MTPAERRTIINAARARADQLARQTPTAAERHPTTLDPPCTIPNEGNLPIEVIREDDEHFTRCHHELIWRGHTIRQQFPWTRSVGAEEN